MSFYNNIKFSLFSKTKGILNSTLFLLLFTSFGFKHSAIEPLDTVAITDTLETTNDLLQTTMQLFFKDDSLSTVIPFSRAGNLIIIKAKADTVEGNFVLDTGAPYLVLNVVYFRDYPVKVMSGVEQTSVSGGAQTVNKTEVRKFSIGEMEYYRNEADLVDLGHIENSKGIKILGLIGFKFLEQCEMIIDYEKKLIYMHRIARKQRKRYRSQHLINDSAFTTLPIEIQENKIIAQTEMNGKKYRFVLDSGAETNIIDSRLNDKFFEQVNITGRLNIRGTGNSSVEALKGDLTNMKIGNNDMGSLPVLIANLERTCFSLDGCANGVLGFDFLPLKKLGFNFITRKMYLWK